MKKVWRCEAVITAYVLSEKEPSDFDALDACEEETRDNGMIVKWVDEVKDINRVLPQWRDGILRGDNPDELTPKDVLGEKP